MGLFCKAAVGEIASSFVRLFWKMQGLLALLEGFLEDLLPCTGRICRPSRNSLLINPKPSTLNPKPSSLNPKP